MVAPQWIGGKWAIDPKGVDDSAYCEHLVIASKEPNLSITQSGRWIDIEFNDDAHTLFRGDIEGMKLNTQTVSTVLATDKNAKCLGNNRLILAATILKDGEQTKLAGQLKVDGCDNCASVPFTATHMPVKR